LVIVEEINKIPVILYKLLPESKVINSIRRDDIDMKQTEIEIEKVWINEKPYVKILGWRNVIYWLDTPSEYRCNEMKVPTYYGFDSSPEKIDLNGYSGLYKRRVDTLGGRIGLVIGDVMTEEEFKDVVAYMKKASERLSAINKKAKWSGKEVIKI
jgi:hypothetical protein